MLRLYLDHDHGAGDIPCPVCNAPLLLGAEKMGRTLVAYWGSLALRPGTRALLVCSRYECVYREPVVIAETSMDAVPFSPRLAAWRWEREQRYFERSLHELQMEIGWLTALAGAKGSPKLASARKHWQQRYHSAYWAIKTCLERAHRDGAEVVCHAGPQQMRGHVRAILDDGVLLEQSVDGETVFLPAGDLRSVFLCWRRAGRARYDFGGTDVRLPAGHYVISTPRDCVVFAGHPFALEQLTRYGLCRISTPSEAAARAVGLRRLGARWYGELPAVLAERAYRPVRHYQVRGHRLYHHAETTDPAILQLATRDMEVARALRMNRVDTRFGGRRRALVWYGFFHRSTIEWQEERAIPLQLPLPWGMKALRL
jgi:hypothetical protein